MTTVNEELLAAAIRHAVHNGRYGRGLAAKIVRLLNAADADIAKTISDRLSAIAERGYDTGPATTARLQEVLSAIRVINAQVYQRIAGALSVELQEFAEFQAEDAATTISRVVTVEYTAKLPTPAFLKTLVEQTPVDGHLMSSWVEAMSAKRLGRIEQALRIGLVQGETIDQLVRRVRGTKARGFTDGVLSVSRRSAETLAITAVSTISNATRLAVYRENDDLIKGVQFTATLDSRTSPQCQRHDGEFYALNKAHPSPPLHPRCRSVLVPVTKSWSELGISKNEADEGTRASMNGQVPASMTYGEWLKKQSASVQEEVLGVERAKLYRDGKVSFDDLYRQDGSYASLSELKKRSRS